jgi:hypothetical protein
MEAARFNIAEGDIGASFLIREIISLLKYQRGAQPDWKKKVI